jgi:hypothetical protein
MARCRTSGLLQGAFTPLEPCIFLVRHPAVSKGPLTCEDMTRREYVSVNPGSGQLSCPSGGFSSCWFGVVE